MYEITKVDNEELVKQMEQKIIDTDNYCRIVINVTDSKNLDDLAYMRCTGDSHLQIKALVATMKMLKQHALEKPAIFEVALRLFYDKKISKELLEKSLEEFERED